MSPRNATEIVSRHRYAVTSALEVLRAVRAS